jgi:hypothetical protein
MSHVVLPVTIVGSPIHPYAPTLTMSSTVSISFSLVLTLILGEWSWEILTRQHLDLLRHACRRYELQIRRIRRMWTRGHNGHLNQVHGLCSIGIECSILVPWIKRLRRKLLKLQLWRLILSVRHLRLLIVNLIYLVIGCRLWRLLEWSWLLIVLRRPILL